MEGWYKMSSEVDIEKLSLDVYKLLEDLNSIQAIGVLESVKFYIQIQTWEALE